MSHIVQVRALEKEGRTGPYNRAGLQFVPGWNEYQVDADQLVSLEADYWLEVRVLDERIQAVRKLDFAKAASKAADEAEGHAKELREKADLLHKEAKAALDAVAHEPPPPAPEPARPFRDALLSAMPGEEKAKYDAAESKRAKK